MVLLETERLRRKQDYCETGRQTDDFRKILQSKKLLSGPVVVCMEIYRGSCCISSCFRRFLLFSSFILIYSTIDASRQPSLHISTNFHLSRSSSHFNFFRFSSPRSKQNQFQDAIFSFLITLNFGGRRISADWYRVLSVKDFSCQFFSGPLSRNKTQILRF